KNIDLLVDYKFQCDIGAKNVGVLRKNIDVFWRTRVYGREAVSQLLELRALELSYVVI
ncbi:hypothetical protein ACLOJK_004497, partial [Asimina triloba]